MAFIETRSARQFQLATYGPKFILAFSCLLGLNLMLDRFVFHETIRRNIVGNVLFSIAFAWVLTWPFTRKGGERKDSPSC